MCDTFRHNKQSYGHMVIHLVAGAERKCDTQMSISHTNCVCVCVYYLAPAAPVYKRQYEANECQKDCEQHETSVKL